MIINYYLSTQIPTIVLEAYDFGFWFKGIIVVKYSGALEDKCSQV